MVFSITGSLKSLLWVTLVLGIVFFIFGISFTTASTELLAASETRQEDVHSKDIHILYGTLDRTLLSLYLSMSGGDDWGNYYNAFEDVPLQKFFYLVYITFATFMVTNVVTSVFVESAIQSAYSDREVVVHEEMENKREYLANMREIYEEMDGVNGRPEGEITLADFEARLADERVMAYFNSLKLDVSDARTLFQLIDVDSTGSVCIDEFLIGCYKLQRNLAA